MWGYYMGENMKYYDVMKYLIAGDEKIADVMKKALQIKTCEFMFRDDQPIGRKYAEYRKAMLAAGRDIGEVITGFVDLLNGGDRKVLSSEHSAMGEDIVTDYLYSRERIKRTGSVIADVEKKAKQTGVLAARVSHALDSLIFYRTQFICSADEQVRLDMVSHLKADRVKCWSAPNKIESIMGDVAIAKYFAETSGKIANNIGDSDNKVLNSYKSFANEMNEEYVEKSNDVGVEYVSLAPTVDKEAETKTSTDSDKKSKAYKDAWTTYGKLHPHEISASKLQKKMRPYNLKAIAKWLEGIIESIDSIPVKITNNNHQM